MFFILTVRIMLSKIFMNTEDTIIIFYLDDQAVFTDIEGAEEAIYLVAIMARATMGVAQEEDLEEGVHLVVSCY
ncbi:MAG: hypothetical protein NZ455_05400 [Bacteroidia bacterium]|nr:hypothetical protein [Bacteroidia bacterium]